MEVVLASVQGVERTVNKHVACGSVLLTLDLEL